ncbi:hypothetical protein [Synechococcus phage MinM1]|nr:hypothetical protein [Synechococcus phage MinM1]
MRVLRAILAELARPDDQGRDWYGWLTAQAGHALLGVVLAGAWVTAGGDALTAWLVVGIAYALAKELPDYAIAPGWRTARDCLRDALFVSGGAGLAATLAAGSALFWLALGAIAAGLTIGTYQRAARALAA